MCFWGKNQKLNFKRHQYNKISKIRRKSRRKWLDFLSKICKSSKLFRLFWGDIWFLNFTKLKTAHKSLNNGVRAVLTPFLDFQFFWTFWTENPFFWGKNLKKFPKNNHSSVNLMINSEKTCHQPQNAPIISSIISIFLADNQLWFWY